MSDFKNDHFALVSRIVDGTAKTARADRKKAFDNAGLKEPVKTLVGKVAEHAKLLTDDDVDAARASGLSEDQIFEIVVAAAIGEATRQYTSALRALDATFKKE